MFPWDEFQSNLGHISSFIRAAAVQVHRADTTVNNSILLPTPKEINIE